MMEVMAGIVVVVTILLCAYVGIASKNILFVVATGFVGVIGGAIVMMLLSTSPILAGGVAFFLAAMLWYFIREGIGKVKTSLALEKKDNGAYKTLSGVYWCKPLRDSHASFVILKKNKVGFVAGYNYFKTLDEARETFERKREGTAPMTATMSYTIVDYDETQRYALVYEKDEKPSRYVTANADGTIAIDFGYKEAIETYVKIV